MSHRLHKHASMPSLHYAILGLIAMFVMSWGGTAAAFVVTNTNDFGPGSLRRAINNANSTAGPDGIVFNIPGPGPHIMTPPAAAPLPVITETVIIDGYSQSGSSANTNPLSLCDTALGTDAIIKIVIDGSGAGPGPGLHISASDCVVKGLSIVN